MAGLRFKIAELERETKALKTMERDSLIHNQCGLWTNS